MIMMLIYNVYTSIYVVLLLLLFVLVVHESKYETRWKRNEWKQRKKLHIYLYIYLYITVKLVNVYIIDDVYVCSTNGWKQFLFSLFISYHTLVFFSFFALSLISSAHSALMPSKHFSSHFGSIPHIIHSFMYNRCCIWLMAHSS